MPQVEEPRPRRRTEQAQTGLDAIRRAMASGEYLKARALWQEHIRRLRAEIQNRTLTADRLAETRALVEWCANVARCAKAHAQVRLNQSAAAGSYVGRALQPAPRISANA